MRESCRILAAALLGLLCSACSVTRHIPEGQYFLQKVKIEDDRSTPRKERITASDMEKYVRQTPNKRFLGTNFYVWLYEQADPAKDNRWNNWKRKIGQAPVTLDMGLTQKSAENLKVYMDSKGFFSSQATYEVDTVSRRKRATVTFRTRQGEPYRIDSVSYEFQDNFLEQIVLPDTVNTLLHTGDIYDVSVLDAERERIAETKRVSGVATGSYAINPFTGKAIPIYISDYVLAGYGTGAIMAVPAHDSRDYAFARHFGLEIIPVVEGGDIEKESYDAKSGKLINSDLLDGLDVKEAIGRILGEIERRGLGRRLVNYRLRDAIFSRQRYWGEPFPIYYKEGTAYPLPEERLPLELPPIDNFGPTEQGEPPLARVKEWTTPEGYPLEVSTMPGFAGSSAYYLRYMDPHNDRALVGRAANEYWRNVDLYVGGIEHATGHLMYSRFWNMFLYDLGYVCEPEPFKKLVNQGMIQGRSNFVYRVVGTNKFVSLGLKDQYKTQEIHVDVNIVRNDILDLDAFRAWRPEFKDAEFILEEGRYVCGWAIEKMSKSMFNVVNPDYIVDNYGADTLRMYEMFLGPLEQSKPWDTNGIDGVHKFLRRFWALFYNREGQLILTDEKATDKELKTLHKTIKKVREDIENFSFNTSVAAFMICLNELGGCPKREILEPLTVLLAPFAPHIAEELWHTLGHTTSVCDAQYPVCEEKYLVESSFEYPVSVNGKLRFKKEYALTLSPADIQADIVRTDEAQKWLEGKAPKKIIVVPGKIINIVI